MSFAFGKSSSTFTTIPMRTTNTTYQLFVILVTVTLLVISTVQHPLSLNALWVAVLTALFCAVLVNFPLPLLQSEITLLHWLSLGICLLYGPVTATWGVVLGVLVGKTARALQRRISHRRRFSPTPWLQTGFIASLQGLPLLMTLFVFTWPLSGGMSETGYLPSPAVRLGVMLLFTLLHSLLTLINFILLGQPVPLPNLKEEIVFFSLVELMPLPFIWLSVEAHPKLGINSVGALGGLAAILSIIMHAMSTARREAERRLKEIDTLNQVSQTMRSTLDLEQLLTCIQQQVTQFLGVDSFYVALLDTKEQHIWYPLAVKNGQRQPWKPRAISDRLTDRVIQKKESILLTKQYLDELEKTGLPTSEETPSAWLGVPLISSDQVFGCLAVFSMSPQVQFSQGDLNLLTALSGQVSVAIDNALLFQQAQLRAAQLETLNQLSALISASLDPEEVFPQVCRAIIQVEKGQHSAIFLVEPEQQTIWLAHSQGLSKNFQRQMASFPRSGNGRALCLQTGQPVLIPNLNLAKLEPLLVKALKGENIQAYGDFPLTTPSGHIGYLSVYFDTPHTFHDDEIELLQTFATQAALAVSNARLYARTDMSLTRRGHQLRILEEIAHELTAALRSERLFDMILEYAMEYTQSQHGFLGSFDEKTQQVKILASSDPQTFQAIPPDPVSWRAIRIRQPINLSKSEGDSPKKQGDEEQLLSQLSVPLIHENRVLGVITLKNTRDYAYRTADQHFISQLAHHAAVAIAQADLYHETQQRLRESSTLYEISMQLATKVEPVEVLETITKTIHTLTGTRCVGAYLWDEELRQYTLKVSQLSTAGNHQHLPSTINPLGMLAIQKALSETSPLEIGRDPQISPLFGDGKDTDAVVYPLVSAGQRLGLMLLHTPKDNPLVEADRQLLQAIVTQGSLALQNARLFTDVRQGRDRLSAVLNSVVDSVLMIDMEGCIALANNPITELINLPLEKVLNRKITSLSATALKSLGYRPQEIKELVEQIGKGYTPPPKATIQFETPMTKKMLKRTLIPVWGQKSNIIGCVIVLRDVTEEHQLNQARELLTETLVHDLRSPVSAIRSALDLVTEGFSSDTEELTAQAINVARRSTKRVIDLIESLLEISCMQTGKVELQLSPVDLNVLTNEILKEFKPQAKELDVFLSNAINPDLPFVHVDNNLIGRVVTNLIDNALKFTPAGGKVTITAEQLPPKQVAVRVSDTGPGIPETFHQKIFERFSQVPGIRGRRRGSGLGLAFCRLAVEAHGGDIWVEPNPSGGSVFAFTLPLSSTSVDEQAEVP
ncbi:MAG: GAF domain-containing protein [Chloroflexota bacterium]